MYATVGRTPFYTEEEGQGTLLFWTWIKMIS